MFSKLKAAYLDVAYKLFFHDDRSSDNSDSNKPQDVNFKDMAKQSNDSKLNGINCRFNWDFNSVKRREYIKGYFEEEIRQAKEIVKNL